MNKEFKKLIQTYSHKCFALYLHIPFCKGKCRYCDFYSIDLSCNNKYAGESKRRYIEMLKKEIKIYSSFIKDAEVKTIFIGGGTPSLLTPDEINEVIHLICTEWNEPVLDEITMEANPFTLTEEKAKNYYRAGVNRISLGIQSFNNDELQFLGRRHERKSALKSVEIITKYFDNFNLDLIFAVPGQSMESWKETLETAVKLNPPHLSLYNLQIEEGTVLGSMLDKGEIEKVDDEKDAHMYTEAVDYLAEAGYKRYEISNFSRGNHYSRHNREYWLYNPYLGLGPAAHSFTGIYRMYNYSNLELYYQLLDEDKPAVEKYFALNKEDFHAELVFMGLRLEEGVKFKRFKKRTGYDLDTLYKEEIHKLSTEGLLVVEDDGIRLTKKGILYGNDVFMRFLP